jgi:diguanylate cyclase (GGDEF)-like protein
MKRILVAEDNLNARTMLANILKKRGYEVVAVPDGQATWEVLLQPDPPRLILLDWVMPGMDGLEVIRQVRARLIEQPPYIILLTGKHEKDDLISGLETGANDYIQKPFDYEELYARIKVGERTVELQASLYAAQQSLAHLATHDPLTGCLNRRAILEQLTKEISRSRRSGPLLGSGNRVSIGFFDLDHFKQINDQYGHQTGDEVLKGIAELLSGQLRDYDTFGRMGGDEFLVVAPGTDDASYKNLFERLIEKIADARLQTCAGPVRVTISLGVALANRASHEDELLAWADAAMYQAKRAGGNQIVYAEAGVEAGDV